MVLMDIIKEKIDQAIELLRELQIDLWLVFVRETRVQADPTVEMVVGHEASRNARAARAGFQML